MNGNPKINSSFISKWHPRYDEIANDEEEYRNLVNIASREIGQIGTLSKETFIRILNWKSPRVKGIVRLTQFINYEEGISRAHQAEENQKLPILIELRGIAGPVGSTILHFMYPDSFPIIDVRTTQVLYDFGYISKCSSDQKYYLTFKVAIHKIAHDCPGFSLREIDRALFAYHKIYLASKSTKNRKTKMDHHKSLNWEGGMESFHEFVVRLSNDVGCYYRSTSKAPLYSLKKYNTDEHGKMGVFAWVTDLKRMNSFKIETYWYLADIAGVVDLADEIKDGMIYVSKKHDPERKGTGISVFVQNGSYGTDYQKVMKILKAVMQLK